MWLHKERKDTKNSGKKTTHTPMKGTSKVIMGATLVMVVTLAVVLGLILVLLAELYCSLLLRRRKLRNTTPNSTTTTIANASSPSHAPHSPPPPPLTSIYSQGVLQAPRSLLFPAVIASTQDTAEPNKHHHHPSELHQVIQIQTQDSKVNANANACPRCIGLVSVSSSPLASFMSRAPPSKPVQQDSLQGSASETIDKSCSNGEQHLVYISNPIYENEEGKTTGGSNTPFETPDTSPSHLERSGSSGDGDDGSADEASPCGGVPCTPPLTPMKKLPAEASSVSLRDARSLGTSGSDSHSNNALSSSSSASPCTSPSW